MGKLRNASGLVIFMLVMSACSSSKKTAEADAPLIETADTEAITDDVPSAPEEDAAPIADATGEESTADTAASADISDKSVTDETPSEQDSPAPEAMMVDSSSSDESSAMGSDMAATDSTGMVASDTPSQSTMSGGEKIQYRVQPGDTLMKIAFEHYGDLYQWKKIFEDNQAKISNPNALVVGSVLEFEKPAYDVSIERNGEKYLIRLGDTLGKISGEVYGTVRKWRLLWENNRTLIKDPNKIFAGFYLYYVKEHTPQTLTQSEVPALTPPTRSVANSDASVDAAQTK